MPQLKKYRRGGKAFPDLTGDGKVTKADILKGRGVFGRKNKKKEFIPGGLIAAGLGQLAQRSNNPFIQKAGQVASAIGGMTPGGKMVNTAANTLMPNAAGGAAGGGGGMGVLNMLPQLLSGEQGMKVPSNVKMKYANEGRMINGDSDDPPSTTPSFADFLADYEKKMFGEPEYEGSRSGIVTMSPMTPGEMLDDGTETMGVDKTRVAYQVPVPRIGEEPIIEEEKEEEKEAPNPPPRMEPMRRRDANPLPVDNERGLMTGDGSKATPKDMRRKKVLFGEGPRAVPFIKSIAQEREGSHNFETLDLAPESEARMLIDLYKDGKVTKYVMDDYMKSYPGMTLEEAALRRAMGKHAHRFVSPKSRSYVSYEDLMNEAALSEGVDIYDFVETGGTTDVNFNPKNVFKDRRGGKYPGIQ